MRHPLSLAMIVGSTLAGGFVFLGCAQKVQTVFIGDEGGTDAAVIPKKDGGTSGSSGSSGSSSGSSGSSGSSSGSSGSGTCPNPTAIDATQLPWKAPAKTVGACSAAELNALVTFVDTNASATYADWKASVANATCRSCIFGLETATQWAPLLEDGAGQLVGLNVGGCIAIASNNQNCGKAYQNWFDCRFEACADCPQGNSAALQTCLSDASKAGAACNTAVADVETACTAAGITDAETACDGTKFVFEGPVKAQCVGGIP